MTSDTHSQGPDTRTTYLFLGIDKPERLAALAQLVRFAIFDGPVAVSLPEGLDASVIQNCPPSTAPHPLTCSSWALSPTHIAFDKAPACPTDTMAFFIVGDGRADPIHLIETLARESQQGRLEINRVITWIDLARCHASKAITAWYDACAHFSDCLLLDLHSNLEPAWIDRYIERFTSQHYPCIIERMKKGIIQHPVFILDDQVRRISTVFEPTDEPFDLVDGDGIDDEDDEPFDPLKEPYFDRGVDGRRLKPIPDIRSDID